MLRNISTGRGGLSVAQIEGATSTALANANLGTVMYNAVVNAAGSIASATAAVVGSPNPNVQRVAGEFSGSDTELKVLWGFEGYAYRIYGIKITCSVAASDVTICCGEVGDCLAIGPKHRLAIGSELHDGRTEFVGLFDSTPDLSVVLRKTTGATLSYEIDFDYIYS
jgi:hypothetical protein